MSGAPTAASLFATRLFSGEIGDAALLDALEAAALDAAEHDEAGNEWCEREGYPGYTSYASLDDLPARYPAFADLKAFLINRAGEAAGSLGWDMSGRALSLDSLWVNVLPAGAVHAGHIHPLSVLSGTLYLAMPEGAGAIVFEDPRLALMMAAPPPSVSAPEAAQRFVRRRPARGEWLIWESWLRHGVEAGEEHEGLRVTVSFNLSLRSG